MNYIKKVQFGRVCIDRFVQNYHLNNQSFEVKKGYS